MGVVSQSLRAGCYHTWHCASEKEKSNMISIAFCSHTAGKEGGELGRPKAFFNKTPVNV